MAEAITRKSFKSGHGTEKRATELLAWLSDFLPTALPASAEEAILDISGDVNALLWHRSELEGILQKKPTALTSVQKRHLDVLDDQIRQSALLIVGAEKGELRRFREGHYDRSHWWWYLDEMLNEANLSGNPKRSVEYAVDPEGVALLKVAEPRAAYQRKSGSKRK